MPIEHGHAEYCLLMISEGTSIVSWTITAIKVPGRKTKVTMAIVLIDVLSRRASSVANCEFFAILALHQSLLVVIYFSRLLVNTYHNLNLIVKLVNSFVSAFCTKP